MKKRLFLIFALVLTTVLVSAQDIAEPVPYPPGQAIGGGEIPTFSLDEILYYGALDSYNEPEWIAELVAAGELPPVEERLPENPQVILESFMSTVIGQYGGVWRDFSGIPTEGWNLCAGQTQGWYGVNAIYDESLVQSGPAFLRNDNVEPLPNLATDWEWSEDGFQLTMNLIRGAKWSDGDDFNADDVMFTWEHVILDDNVNSWTNATTWQINGEPITLEKVDDDTVLWTFPVERPVQRLFDMDFLSFTVCPEHVYAPMHPAFNPDSDYQTFETFQVQDDLPVVSMGPWVPVEYRIDEFLVFRRNPYYWKVDSAGNQLPYLDEVTFEKGTDGIGRTLGTLAGSIDHTNLENPQTYVEAVTRAQEDDAHFYIEWGPETLLYNINLNLSANLGVESEADAAMRELFRTFDFRRAIQHSVDGDGLGQSLVRGPFTRAFSGGIAPGSAYYDIDSAVYYPYSPESAVALLASLGFEDTDGDGVVNWTSGPLEGENLIVSLFSTQADAATVSIAEGLVLLLQDVGIQVNHRTLQGPAYDDAIDGGTWEMTVDRIDQAYTTPFTRCQELAPINNQTPVWHIEGSEPRVLLDFEVEMVDLINQFCLEPDFNARKELLSRYNRLYTENIYTVGGIASRFGLALAKRFENVPVGTPPFYYEWTWSNVMGEQVWVAPENQLAQVLPGVIPVHDEME